MKKLLIVILPMIIGGLLFVGAHLFPGPIGDSWLASSLFTSAIIITIIYGNTIYFLWSNKWWKNDWWFEKWKP